ncbi:hypothetical protein E4T39_05473 [Aureobasidium subglaciale]|nr:hypothetical protein E4T39_05473 [Aureobasidium subglaciale]
MGLPVWRDPEETRSGTNSPAAISRVKNDGTAASRSPIRRLRASRPTTSFHRLGQPPSVPDASRQRVISSERHFDLAYYLGDDSPSEQTNDSSQRRSRPSSFLPPPLERDRPQSRNAVSSSLPTPPLDTSEPTASSRIVLLRPSQQPPHPLSFAHRPLSPDDGLGDRNRSPSPIAEAWHVIGSTITPDDSLPSTHSSFASDGASAAFRRADSQVDALADVLADDSSSTTHDPPADDNRSRDHDRRTVESLLYDFAMQTAEGRAQIQLIRRMAPEDTLWIRHHSNASQEDEGENNDHNHEDTNQDAPTRRPSQFDSDIRERSRQVAASTMRYFGNTSRESAQRTRHNGQTRTTNSPPRSRSTSPSGSILFPNQAARRTNTFLERAVREAERYVRDGED